MKLDRRSLLGFGAVGIFVLGAGSYFGLRPGAGSLPGISPAHAEATPAALLEAGALGDQVLGSPDAPVTIVEYASMTCPHCANFHEGTFPQLKETYVDTGRVRFIFREFPFDDLALAASMIARCAGEDKYFPMVEVMFEQQQVWASNERNPRDELFKIAKLAGMTREQFDACLVNEEVARGILDARERAAREFGVESTPTFFINGKMLRGNQSFDTFEKAIEEATG